MCSVQTFYPLTHQHAKNNLWIFWILRHVIERSPDRHLTPLYFSLAEDNDDQCAPGGGWRHVQRLRQRGRGPGPRHRRPRVWLGIPGEDCLHHNWPGQLSLTWGRGRLRIWGLFNHVWTIANMIAQYTGGCKYINPYHHLCPGRSEEQLWEEASHGSWGRPQGAGDSRGGGGGAHKQQRPDAHCRSVYVIILSIWVLNVKCSAIFDIWSTNGFLLVIVIQSWAPSSFHEFRSHAIVTLRRVSDNCKIPTLNSLQFPCSLLPQTWSLWDCKIASPIIVSVTRDAQCALGVSQPIIDSQIFYWIHVS